MRDAADARVNKVSRVCTYISIRYEVPHPDAARAICMFIYRLRTVHGMGSEQGRTWV